MRKKFPLLLAICLLGGCGAAGDEAVQVTGSVKNADGSVATGESALIVFQPVSEGKSASGSIGPDGAFELMTIKPGDGVQPGQYKVVLRIFKNYREQILAVPEKYADASTTPLEATVDADHRHFDFKIEP